MRDIISDSFILDFLQVLVIPAILIIILIVVVEKIKKY